MPSTIRPARPRSRRASPVPAGVRSGPARLAALLSIWLIAPPPLAQATSRAVAPPLAPPSAPARAPAFVWPEAPVETLGEEHRVREGHSSAPETRAADAERASHGLVIGATPAHAALLRARPDGSSPLDTDAVERTASTPLLSFGRHEDTWVADIGVLLRGDDDRDGFFGAVEFSVDVDTTDVEREVYLVVELFEPNGATTLSHVTRTFTIRGNATSDAYRIEIELLDNHRAAYRDASIVVRDGWSDAWLDDVSAFGFASLAALPLEAERGHGRGPFDDDGDYGFGVLIGGSSHDDRHHHGGGTSYAAGYVGAGGPLGASILLAAAFVRRVVRRRAFRLERASGDPTGHERPRRVADFRRGGSARL